MQLAYEELEKTSPMRCKSDLHKPRTIRATNNWSYGLTTLKKVFLSSFGTFEYVRASVLLSVGGVILLVCQTFHISIKNITRAHNFYSPVR